MGAFADRFGLPALGAGIGLRFEHVERILTESVAGAVVRGRVRELHEPRRPRAPPHPRGAPNAGPIVCHGVSINLGGTDPLDADYLARAEGASPTTSDSPWVERPPLLHRRRTASAMNDLLPLPRTEEAARHVAARGPPDPGGPRASVPRRERVELPRPDARRAGWTRRTSRPRSASSPTAGCSSTSTTSTSTPSTSASTRGTSLAAHAARPRRAAPPRGPGAAGQAAPRHARRPDPARRVGPDAAAPAAARADERARRVGQQHAAARAAARRASQGDGPPRRVVRGDRGRRGP